MGNSMQRPQQQLQSRQPSQQSNLPYPGNGSCSPTASGFWITSAATVLGSNSLQAGQHAVRLLKQSRPQQSPAQLQNQRRSQSPKPLFQQKMQLIDGNRYVGLKLCKCSYMRHPKQQQDQSRLVNPTTISSISE
ncbi:hypothetical protein MLD38_001403 [Melastoma candidum]|uniref:Uncharacterized protein n=1 Tax=Melastoma candidum TaxID=119954 RepID=A0ACB9SEF1_9MYRT|nr:hypothetical protein MLD38_001403 [Melastoma candidum]